MEFRSWFWSHCLRFLVILWNFRLWWTFLSGWWSVSRVCASPSVSFLCYCLSFHACVWSLLVVSCFTLKVSFLLCPAWVWLHFSDLAWWFSPAVHCFLLCAVVLDLVLCSLALGSLVHLKKFFVTLCWCLCPVQLFSTTRPAPFNFSCAGKKVSGYGLQPTCF